MTALLVLFLPIAIGIFLDRKKTFQRSFPYFYLYLFLVGSFATVPVEIVSNFYVLFEGKFAAINLVLAVLQVFYFPHFLFTFLVYLYAMDYYGCQESC